MTAMLKHEIEPALVEFSLNGRALTARPDETILQAADRHGVAIPRLCYTEGMRPDGNCRACVVEIDGERVLAPSCCRTPKAGMKVVSESPRALHSQKMVLELLCSDMPEVVYNPDSELDFWAKKLEIGKPRLVSSLATRSCPQVGCSNARSTTACSMAASTRFFGFGFRRDISISAISPPVSYRSLNR